MKNIKFLISIFSISFLVFSCNAPATEPEIDMDAVKAEITQLEANYTKAMQDKDLDGLMAYYSEDAQSLPPNQPTLVGRDAIRADSEKEMAMDTSKNVSVSMGVTDVWASGDLAVETGTWTVKSADGNVVETGKYMSLFEKRDGKYVCIRDIWNSDQKDDDDDEDDEDDEAAEGADDQDSGS